jgi:hypothetical protein
MRQFGLKLFLCLTAVVLVAGCVTPTNWDARIGTYTFDQAVLAYGPPDKQAKLSDGRKVAEWITRYGNNGATYVSTGAWYPGSVGVIQTTGPTYYESKLQLVFNTNNVLQSWSKK